MKEEHLAIAYVLAVSQVLSENLCDEQTFQSHFGDQSFTSMEREWIGSEACAIRGNETFDWIEVGLNVDFVTPDVFGRQRGNVRQIEVDRINGGAWVSATVENVRNGLHFRVPIENIRTPR